MAIVCKYKIETISDPAKTENQISLGIVWWLEKLATGEKITDDQQTNMFISDYTKSTLDDIELRLKTIAVEKRELLESANQLDEYLNVVMTIPLKDN
jgi:hypothetical protein